MAAVHAWISTVISHGIPWFSDHGTPRIKSMAAVHPEQYEVYTVFSCQYEVSSSQAGDFIQWPSLQCLRVSLYYKFAEVYQSAGCSWGGQMLYTLLEVLQNRPNINTLFFFPTIPTKLYGTTNKYVLLFTIIFRLFLCDFVPFKLTLVECKCNTY